MPRVITPLIVADFRKRLTDAAADLLAERGIEGFNMRELAKRLRVSPMTAYRYFKDKQEILGELRARGFARLGDVLEQAQANGSGTEALQAYAGFALADPVTYRLMFDLFQSPEPQIQELTLHQARVREIMNRLACAPDELPEATGQLWWASLHGSLALHFAGKLDRAAFETALADLLDQFAHRRERAWRCHTSVPATLTAAE